MSGRHREIVKLRSGSFRCSPPLPPGAVLPTLAAMSDLLRLQEAIGHAFHDPDLLRLAMTHPSLAHEAGAGDRHNQRLEFLGDSVLGLVLTQELYVRFPKVSEGPLTKARAQLVNSRTLAEQARRLALGGFLILSRSEEFSGGRAKTSALADAFEALLGALFLDGGFEAARRFVLDCYRTSLDGLTFESDSSNPKGELQELLQANSTEPPHYQLIQASGPDHNRTFECAVFHDGKELGRGSGHSKKEAESAAALAALETLRAETKPAK
jgi:ribonuclease III